jgi:hypothetical protein
MNFDHRYNQEAITAAVRVPHRWKLVREVWNEDTVDVYKPTCIPSLVHSQSPYIMQMESRV